MRYFIFEISVAFGILVSPLCLNAQSNTIDASLQGVYAGKVVRFERKDDSSVDLLLEMRDGRSIEMVLGPDLYLQDIGFSVQPSDEIVAFGYPTLLGKKQVILVHCLRRGADKYLFRDQDGVPLWKARRITLQ